jgi:hypothetical protein
MMTHSYHAHAWSSWWMCCWLSSLVLMLLYSNLIVPSYKETCYYAVSLVCFCLYWYVRSIWYMLRLSFLLYCVLFNVVNNVFRHNRKLHFVKKDQQNNFLCSSSNLNPSLEATIPCGKKKSPFLHRDMPFISSKRHEYTLNPTCLLHLLLFWKYFMCKYVCLPPWFIEKRSIATLYAHSQMLFYPWSKMVCKWNKASSGLQLLKKKLTLLMAVYRYSFEGLTIIELYRLYLRQVSKWSKHMLYILLYFLILEYYYVKKTKNTLKTSFY